MHEIPLLIDMGASEARRCGKYLLPVGIRFYEASVEWLVNLGILKTTECVLDSCRWGSSSREASHSP